MLATAKGRSPAIRGAPDRWEPSTGQAYTCAPALTRPSCWTWSELSPSAAACRLRAAGEWWAGSVHVGADHPFRCG